MKEIPLSQGMVSLVDDEDYPRLSQFKWHAHRNKDGRYYAITSGKNPDGSRCKIKMHRMIMSAPEGVQVDHRDVPCTLDNRKSNLRLASDAENRQHALRRRDNTSGWKGVHYHKRERKWVARIQAEGIRIFLGHFKTAENAAIAYNIAALKYHKEFAILNLAA